MDGTQTQIDYATLTNPELAQTARETWQRGASVGDLGPVFHELVNRIENTTDSGEDKQAPKGRDTS